ncbi:uncharacterized protein ZHAS_00013390 [Anopheles sinensis]|uniref:Uncharacterized protein n=1 Tax=Anopheles sinensis TaxID=74873 RepID=A0A084W5A0_ANOSI|nr:uncharacterized protein ZHAS_00013390 [Anopheles sinensis]
MPDAQGTRLSRNAEYVTKSFQSLSVKESCYQKPNKHPPPHLSGRLTSVMMWVNRYASGCNSLPQQQRLAPEDNPSKGV